MEQVAALSSQNELPEPSLNMSALPPSLSTFNAAHDVDNTPHSPAPAYASDDPWNSRFAPQPQHSPTIDPFAHPAPLPSNGITSAISGTGLPPNWWKLQEPANLTIIGQQGFILARYTVYQILTNRGSVTRRYSEVCPVLNFPFSHRLNGPLVFFSLGLSV